MRVQRRDHAKPPGVFIGYGPTPRFQFTERITMDRQPSDLVQLSGCFALLGRSSASKDATLLVLRSARCADTSPVMCES
jgi:hypothetical protein